jgi:hypothetical protein
MTHPIIDAEKLEGAIREYAKLYPNMDDGETQVGLVLAAARAYLATLPRWKEVEVADWAVINRYGAIVGNFREDECGARQSARQRSLSGHDEYSVVRLTGTAKVKVTT